MIYLNALSLIIIFICLYVLFYRLIYRTYSFLYAFIGALVFTSIATAFIFVLLGEKSKIILPILAIIIIYLLYKKGLLKTYLTTALVLIIVTFCAYKVFGPDDKSNKDLPNSQEIAQTTSDSTNSENTSNNLDNSSYTKNEYKSENEIDTIISTNIENYISAFVDDVNSGKANLCLNYLEKDSPIYNEQIKNIPEISKNFKEKVDSLDIKNIQQISDNTYAVQVIENIYISKNNSEFKLNTYKNSYTVVKLGNEYLIRSMNLNAF
ncbi:hypothetical protein FHH43_06635 [Clostridium perfringens]|nr:hypothetical protein [Clostridium perfringens]